MQAASVALHRVELVRDQIGIQRKPVFVRAGVVVLNGREIHDQAVFASDILVCMPDTLREAEKLAALLREIQLQNVTLGRGVRSRVVEDYFHLALQEAVAVVMLLVHRPAFDETRTNRIEIAEY